MLLLQNTILLSELFGLDKLEYLGCPVIISTWFNVQEQLLFENRKQPSWSEKDIWRDKSVLDQQP